MNKSQDTPTEAPATTAELLAVLTDVAADMKNNITKRSCEYCDSVKLEEGGPLAHERDCLYLRVLAVLAKAESR